MTWITHYEGYTITPHVISGVQYLKDGSWPWLSQRAASEQEALAKIDELMTVEVPS